MSKYDVAGADTTAHVTEQQLKTLQIKCHVGLGDAFVMQGLVHWYLLTARYRKIVINTRAAYVPDLELLYSHVRSSVDFQIHETYDTAPVDIAGADEVIRLGYFADPKELFEVSHWDREFYRQAGVPFINRWLHCYVPTPYPRLNRRDFKVRHHDPKRKFLIEGFKPDYDIVDGERERLLDWTPELMAAAEIHCIDSCVMNLVESMYQYGLLRSDVKLYYHAYARKDPPATVLAPWRTLH